MNSTLLGLPREIKELIYFDALSHAANEILALPLADEVKSISKAAVAALAKDVQFLVQFVDELEGALILKDNLEELQQTVQLMMLENHDEWYDISIRNRKFGRVDAQNGMNLLTKYTLHPLAHE
jgi:virulence-associated protein VapD